MGIARLMTPQQAPLQLRHQIRQDHAHLANHVRTVVPVPVIAETMDIVMLTMKAMMATMVLHATIVHPRTSLKGSETWQILVSYQPHGSKEPTRNTYRRSSHTPQTQRTSSRHGLRISKETARTIQKAPEATTG